MSGFKDEKQLRKYMVPRMRGTWKPVECIHPAGHPDLMGGYGGHMGYVELKISDDPSRDMMEPSQLEFIPWLLGLDVQVWVAVGHPKYKQIRFFEGLDFSYSILPPPFWRGTLLTPKRAWSTTPACS